MKFRISFLAIFFVNVVLLPEQNNSLNQFAKANELYESGDIEGAYVLYKSMSVKTASVWYNMGNAAYKKHNYPQAIAYWHRAMREGGSSFADNCLYNINHVYTEMGIRNQQSWYDVVLNNVGYRSLLFFQALFLVLLYLFSAVLVLLKGHIRIICASSLLLFLSAETIGLVAARSFWCKDTCIVNAEKVPIHVGPDNRFMVTNQIEKASQAQIVDKHSGWYKIKTSNQFGWISAEHVELV